MEAKKKLLVEVKALLAEKAAIEAKLIEEKAQCKQLSEQV